MAVGDGWFSGAGAKVHSGLVLRGETKDGDETIIRVYESHGARGPVKLTFDRPLSSAVERNLLEENDTPVKYEGEELRFNIKPYKIRTFRVDTGVK